MIDGPDDTDLRFMDALDASKAANPPKEFIDKSLDQMLEDSRASIQKAVDENSSNPAFPVKSVMDYEHGLTKREYFSGLAMQGLVANMNFSEADEQTLAELAVDQADQLLIALESTTPPVIKADQ